MQRAKNKITSHDFSPQHDKFSRNAC